jgi:Tfp pilus assembly protein PilF
MSGSIRSDLQRAGISDPADLLLRFIAADDALRRFGRGAPRITDDNLRLEYSSPREIWRNRLPDLLSSLERIRQSPAAIFPEIMDPSQQALRDLLAERERGRRERMRAARSLSPRDLEALASPALQAAMDSLRNGNSERAAIFLQQARREVPFAPIVPMLSGWIALGEGRSAEAETAFRAALRLDPRSSEGQEGLGLSLYRQGKLDDAAGSLRKAVEGAPGDPETTANLGAVLLAQGKNEEALRWLDRSIAADARQISARVNRGVALARLGRAEEAIREYQAALAMDPLNEDALFNLRRAEQRLGKVPSSP